jgi:hypothetical protein
LDHNLYICKYIKACDYFLKNHISISFVALAVVWLLLGMLVPHHHHNGEVCMVVEQCHEDGAFNDKHTHHGQEHEDNGDDNCCIAKSNYVSPNISKLLKIKNPTTDNGFHPDLPAMLLLFIGISVPESVTDKRTDYGEYIPIHLSDGAICAAGLRAPPALNI